MSETKTNKEVTQDSLSKLLGAANACYSNNKIELLPHNQMLYDKIVSEINNGEYNIFYSEATGLGKSFIFMKLVQEYFSNKRVLYVVPKISIWDNLIKYKEFSYLNADIIMTTYAAFNTYDPTLCAIYDAVFIDECHHMLSDIQGNNLYMFCKELKNLQKYSFGFTATPYYMGKYVDEALFDCSCYGYDVYEAIELGLLPKIKLACASIDLDDIPFNYKIQYSITGTESLLQRIVQEHPEITRWIAYFKDKAELYERAQELQDIFPEYRILKVYAGNDEEDSIVFDNFNNTSQKVILLSVNKLLEGVHLRDVQGVLLYRNVQEFSTYMQMYGRLCDINAKVSPLFLDVTNAIVGISKVSEFKSSRYLGGRREYTPKELFDINASDYWTVELFDKLNTYNKSFTKEERDIMMQYYNNIPFIELCQMLPDRTSSSIRAFALRNGLTREKGYWTTEEDEILKKYYPEEGTVAFERLPDRTLQSCKRRVSILNLTHARNYWTTEEEEILRMYYPSEGTDVYKRLSNRTRSSIERKAQNLGIKYQPNPNINGNWSVEEDTILRQYYPIEGKKCVDRFPTKTECVVLARAFKLGLRVVGTFWTPEEEQILRDNYPVMKSKVVNLLPGKTVNAVKGKARMLGLVGEAHRSWTSEEDAILRKEYPKLGLLIKDLLPNKSERAIISRASLLGIKSGRNTNLNI